MWGIVRVGWSGKRDLNPRLQPWQGCTLPLSYSRSRRRYSTKSRTYESTASWVQSSPWSGLERPSIIPATTRSRDDRAEPPVFHAPVAGVRRVFPHDLGSRYGRRHRTAAAPASARPGCAPQGENWRRPPLPPFAAPAPDAALQLLGLLAAGGAVDRLPRRGRIRRSPTRRSGRRRASYTKGAARRSAITSRSFRSATSGKAAGSRCRTVSIPPPSG